jgi:hypothetical protein
MSDNFPFDLVYIKKLDEYQVTDDDHIAYQRFGQYGVKPHYELCLFDINDPAIKYVFYVTRMVIADENHAMNAFMVLKDDKSKYWFELIDSRNTSNARFISDALECMHTRDQGKAFKEFIKNVTDYKNVIPA